MKSFKTQFVMSGVRTYVTVEQLEDHMFGCILNLVEFFEGNEIPVKTHDYDLVLKLDSNAWINVGPSKVHLSSEDLNSLGDAIRENLLQL
jgi:hypothetical protein